MGKPNSGCASLGAHRRVTAPCLSCRQDIGEMFAVCPANAPFQQGRGAPALGTAIPGEGHGPDSNSNFVGEVCDSNENWSQPAPGSPPEEGSSRSENTTNPSDNLLLLMQRQMVQGRLRDTAPGLGDVHPEQGVRSPPEGAEVGGAGGTRHCRGGGWGMCQAPELPCRGQRLRQQLPQHRQPRQHLQHHLGPSRLCPPSQQPP